MIGIVFIGDLKYCPYLNRYTESLEKSNTKYEVLYWNREGSSNKYPDNYIGYVKKSRLNKSIYHKFFDFIGYKLWLNRKLKNTKYDKLIILSTLSGIISFEFLLNKYKNKYIFDIRDYSYEHNRIFYMIEKKIIENSYFTCISSEGFKNFLPQDYPYIIAHNFSIDDYKNRKRFTKKKNGALLNLVFIGSVRYFEHQVKIINHLKDDHRFRMYFHGSGAELDIFIQYCKENKIQNVIFTGGYDNSDKYKLLKNADLLNNSYKTSKFLEVKYAISNKFYDGLIYGIPQLVETETYKQEKVEELEVGVGIDENDTGFADKLYNYYFNIDEDLFALKSNEELGRILSDEDKYSKKIKDFIYI